MGSFTTREFADKAHGKEIAVLGIPDVYYRDEPGLVAILREKLSVRV